VKEVSRSSERHIRLEQRIQLDSRLRSIKDDLLPGYFNGEISRLALQRMTFRDPERPSRTDRFELRTSKAFTFQSQGRSGSNPRPKVINGIEADEQIDPKKVTHAVRL
jgi:hypothetical protein